MVEPLVADAAPVDTSPADDVLLPEDEPDDVPVAIVVPVPSPDVLSSGVVVDGDTVVNPPVSPCGCEQPSASDSTATPRRHARRSCPCPSSSNEEDLLHTWRSSPPPGDNRADAGVTACPTRDDPPQDQGGTRRRRRRLTLMSISERRRPVALLVPGPPGPRDRHPRRRATTSSADHAAVGLVGVEDAVAIRGETWGCEVGMRARPDAPGGAPRRALRVAA